MEKCQVSGCEVEEIHMYSIIYIGGRWEKGTEEK
jgi:hypothetical protein